MSRKLSYLPDEEPNELVKRYEAFLNHRSASGYFDVEEMEQIVDYYLQKGRTKDSSTALELGFRLHPNNPTLLGKRAKIYLALGDAKKAFRILESISTPMEYEMMLLKMDALARLDRNKEAILLADNLLSESSQDKDTVCLDIAYIFLARLDATVALKYLQQGAKINPLNLDLLFELAFCYEQLSENEKAIQTYHTILKHDPYSSEAWFNLGQLYFIQQDFLQALTAYDYAQVIRPEDSLTTLQKAHSHFQLQQYSKAIEEYLAYEKMSAENWQTYLFIGECYERLENFVEAIRFYTKSLNEEPENYEALTGIAICLMEQELYAESLKFTRKALELREDAPDGWVYLAEALVGTDDTDAALLAYLRSIQLDPNQPDTLMAIANICMERGEFELALQYYTEAQRLDTDFELENINLFMAIAFYKTGLLNEAMNFLDLALAENLDAMKLFYELCPEALDDEAVLQRE